MGLVMMGGRVFGGMGLVMMGGSVWRDGFGDSGRRVLEGMVW